jgi:hypothetical protein
MNTAMFEGGMAGASATALAADRRTSAQRLLSEAARLEELAADERRVASQLAKLPASYSILHDLLVPGAEAGFDHVVLGPGGVFLVVSHRHDGPIVVGPELVQSTDHPVMVAIRGIVADAHLLAEALGTPVAPVLALVGPESEVEMPLKVEGATLVPIDRVDRAVSRGSHTLLASKAIAEVSERALPLLTTPSTVQRTADSFEGAADDDEVDEIDTVITALPVAEVVVELPAKAAAASAPARPSADGRRRWRMPTMLAGAAVAALGLATFSAGSLISTLGSSITSRAAGLDATLVRSAQVFSPESSTTAGAVAAPRFRFAPVCPVPGAGWQLQPSRLDAGTGAAFYEVEARGIDGVWTRVATLPAESLGSTPVLRLGSDVAVDLRVTAIAADGRRSAAAAVAATTPADPC